MKTPCPGFKLFITCQPDLKIILSLGTLVPLDYSSPLNITPPLVQYNQHAYTDNRKGKYFSSGLGPNRANRVFPCKNRSNKKSVHQRSLSLQQASFSLQFRRRLPLILFFDLNHLSRRGIRSGPPNPFSYPRTTHRLRPFWDATSL